jgi:predicted metal-dependent hydrolase
MIERVQPGGGYLLRYAGYAIPFRVSVGDRSKLIIHVYPDMRVEVLAPKDKDLDLVLARVDRRARWILKQWRYFEQFQPKQPDRRFVSGETHVYLGRQYRLKVAKGIPSQVKLIGRYFLVRHSDPDDFEEVSRLLQDWYRRHARSLFAGRVSHWISECRPLAMPEAPTVTIRKMTRRWGSCTKKGIIALNIDLIKVPLTFIDYVIVHELCHLRIHNHSPAFYKLLTRSMPDWRQRKERLESLST